MRWSFLIASFFVIVVIGVVGGIAAIEAFELIRARSGYLVGLGGLVLLIVLMGFVLPPAMEFALWLVGLVLDRISAETRGRIGSVAAGRLEAADGSSPREMQRWSNKAELEGELRRAGLGEWAPRLAGAAQDSIIFAPGSVEEGATAPIGASRLGGEPDLPPEVDWPVRPPIDAGQPADAVPGSVLLGRRHWLHRLLRTPRWKEVSQGWERSRRAEREIRGRAWPLSFVAQVDFAELHAVQPLDGFPSTGRLLLFCDPFDWPWGAREDQARVRAIFTEVPAERLQRRPYPREFDEPAARHVMSRGYVFKPRSLRPTAWLLPPSPGSADQPRAPQWPAWEIYCRFWSDLFARYPDVFGARGSEAIHQVGGFAFSIQAPVGAECIKFAEHTPRPSRRGRNDVQMYAPTKEQLARAGEWQLVLQIDSDIEVGMEWGDAGRLYLCARKEDLAARRFDRCWMVMQCY